MCSHHGGAPAARFADPLAASQHPIQNKRVVEHASGRCDVLLSSPGGSRIQTQLVSGACPACGFSARPSTLTSGSLFFCSC